LYRETSAEEIVSESALDVRPIDRTVAADANAALENPFNC
jgi:hypothetical protein